MELSVGNLVLSINYTYSMARGNTRNSPWAETLNNIFHYFATTRREASNDPHKDRRTITTRYHDTSGDFYYGFNRYSQQRTIIRQITSSILLHSIPSFHKDMYHLFHKSTYNLHPQTFHHLLSNFNFVYSTPTTWHFCQNGNLIFQSSTDWTHKVWFIGVRSFSSIIQLQNIWKEHLKVTADGFNVEGKL